MCCVVLCCDFYLVLRISLCVARFLCSCSACVVVLFNSLTLSSPLFIWLIIYMWTRISTSSLSLLNSSYLILSFFITSLIFLHHFSHLLPGNEIDATTAAKVHTVEKEKEKEVEDTRKRSASEGNYEKKRKYQRKNSISSCAGFSSTSDYGLVDIDCSSGDFEVGWF